MDKNENEITLTLELKNMVSTKMIRDHINANKGFMEGKEMEKMYDDALKALSTTLDNTNAKLRCLVETNKLLPDISLRKLIDTRRCRDWLLEDVYLDTDHPTMLRVVRHIEGIFSKGVIGDKQIPESHRLQKFINTFFILDEDIAATTYCVEGKVNVSYFKFNKHGVKFATFYSGVHTGIFFEMYSRWCAAGMYPEYTEAPTSRGVTDMMQNHFKHTKTKCHSLGLIHDIRYKETAKSQGYCGLFPNRAFLELFLDYSHAYNSWEHTESFRLHDIRSAARHMLSYLAQD